MGSHGGMKAGGHGTRTHHTCSMRAICNGLRAVFPCKRCSCFDAINLLGAPQGRVRRPWQRPVRVAPAPPGDARTARRRMKAVELSAVFQSKQRAEKGSREKDKSIANRTQPELGSIRRQNRPLFPQVAPASPHARQPGPPARPSGAKPIPEAPPARGTCVPRLN